MDIVSLAIMGEGCYRKQMYILSFAIKVVDGINDIWFWVSCKEAEGRVMAEVQVLKACSTREANISREARTRVNLLGGDI